MVTTETKTTESIPQISNPIHIQAFKNRVIASEQTFEDDAQELLMNHNELATCSCSLTHAFCECQQICCLCGETITKPTNLIFWNNYERNNYYESKQ